MKARAVSLLLAIITQPAAAGQFSVADNKGLSHNNHMVIVQPTPKCWNAATEIFPEISSSVVDTITFCALLPEQDQKRLALEIARCHMLDLGKPLVHRPCHELDDCLKDLTPEGANAYTHYVTYVQQLCIRLTQELLLQQQHQTQVEMGDLYKQVSQETLAQVQNLQRSVMQQVQNLDNLSDFPQQLRDNLGRELQKTLSQTLSQSLDRELEKHLSTQLENQLGQQLSQLLQQQAMYQASFVEGILDKLDVRDQELHERFKLWEHYQTSLWSTHALEVEKQRRQIEEQRSRMEYLSDALFLATRSLQPPLVRLKAVLNVISVSYRWLVMCSHLLVHLLVIWMMTRPRRCRSFRVRLFQVIIVEAVLEMMINSDWMLDNEVVVGNERRLEVIYYLRMIVRLAVILIYLIGILGSFKRMRKTSLMPTFALEHDDWEMTNDSFVYYYPSRPPIPQPGPLVTRTHVPKRHRRVSYSPRATETRETRLLDMRIQPRRRHGAPNDSSTTKAIFRTVPPPREDVLVRNLFREEIITPFSNDDEEEQEEYHDVMDSIVDNISSPIEANHNKKRTQDHFAAPEERNNAKKSKNDETNEG